MTSRVRAIVVGILVLATAAGGYWWYRVGETRRVANTVLVRRGAITATVETTGKVRSARQVELSLPFGGRVKKMAVAVGDEVEAGQLLLELGHINEEQISEVLDVLYPVTDA